MKKETLKTILGFVGMMSLFLACGEGETILSQLLWSGSWLLVSFLSLKGFGKLMTDKEKEERA